jgi:hypothetical protein
MTHRENVRIIKHTASVREREKDGKRKEKRKIEKTVARFNRFECLYIKQMVIDQTKIFAIDV